MSAWNSLQNRIGGGANGGPFGGGSNATSSLEDLIRNQRRGPPIQPPTTATAPKSTFHPPPQFFNSQGNFPQNKGFPTEKITKAVTPPRPVSNDMVPLEYSPPTNHDHFSPFRGLTKPTFDIKKNYDDIPSASSTYPTFDPVDQSATGRINNDGRGRGRPMRGNGVAPAGPGITAQKFSCRVCKLSFDSKQLLNAHLIEKQHFHTQGTDATIPITPDLNKRTFLCRVCNATFDNNPALYSHLKTEGHFNSTGNNNFTDSFEKFPVASSNAAPLQYPANDAANSYSYSSSYPSSSSFAAPAESTYTSQVRPPPATIAASAQPRPPAPPQIVKSQPNVKNTRKYEDVKPSAFPLPNTSANTSTINSSSTPLFENLKPSPKIEAEPPRVPNVIPKTVTSAIFSQGPKIADLSGNSRKDQDEDAPVFRSSKFPPKSDPSLALSASSRPPAPTIPVPAPLAVDKFDSKFSSENGFDEEEDGDRDGDDIHSDGQVVGTCTDMCPEDEILIRLKANEIHIFEQPVDDLSVIDPSEKIDLLKTSMIKQYQRSAADHKLAIPHLVRTPRTLYDTMCYIEQNIMSLDLDLYDETNDIPEEEKNPNALDVYVFIWNRFRMIAKDFILQNYRFGGRVDEYCIECHERMTRWHIMCHHQLQWSSDYLISHSYTNNEQLNKLMKTLNELYDEVHLRQSDENEDNVDKPTVAIPNEGEIRSYYVLYQLDNGGEVEKYLQKLHPAALNHPSMQFAIKVVRARRVSNYATFFRLLRDGNYLQSCAMFKYVGFMRLEGLKVMNRVLCAGKLESQIPLSDLTRMLVFEDDDETEEFVTHCGLEVTFSSSEESKFVILNGKNIVEQLPRKKSSKPNQYSAEPELPPVRLMYTHIEGKVVGFTRAEICQGSASDTHFFEDHELVEDNGYENEQIPSLEEEEEDTDVIPTEGEEDGDEEVEQNPEKEAEEDTSVENDDPMTSLPLPTTPTLTRQRTSEQRPEHPTLKRGSSQQKQGLPESPRHSSVAESIMAMKRSGKSLTSDLSKESSPIINPTLPFQSPLPSTLKDSPPPPPFRVSANPFQTKTVQPVPMATPIVNPPSPSLPLPLPLPLSPSPPLKGQLNPILDHNNQSNQRPLFQSFTNHSSLVPSPPPPPSLPPSISPSPPHYHSPLPSSESSESLHPSSPTLEQKNHLMEIEAAKKKQRQIEEEHSRKLRQLELLENRLEKFIKKQSLHKIWKIWIESENEAMKRRKKLVLKLMFMNWRRVWTRLVMQREALNLTLSSLMTHSFNIPSLNNSFPRNIRRNLNSKLSTEPLSHLPSLQLDQSISRLLGASPLHWFHQKICNKIAPSLFFRQTNYLRNFLQGSTQQPHPQTDSFNLSGPLWNRALFMNVGLLHTTMPSSSRSWDFSTAFLPNLIRALLTEKETTSDYILSSWKMNAICHQTLTRKTCRKIHVVITGDVVDFIPLSGVIILPVSAMEDDSLQDLLYKAVLYVENNVPLVVIVTNEIFSDSISSLSSSWKEITTPAENTSLANFLQALANLCQRSITISKAFLLEVVLSPQYLSILRSDEVTHPLPSHLHDALLKTTSCVVSCFLKCVEVLADSVQLIPPIKRIDVSRWYEECVTSAMWASEYSIDDISSPASCEQVLFDLFNRIEIAMNQCKNVILQDSRLQESFNYPFIVFQKSHSAGVVEDVVYLNTNEHLLEIDVCDLPTNWESLNCHSTALEILHQFQLPEWKFEGEVMSQWKQFCDHLIESGWDLPRNSLELLQSLATSLEPLTKLLLEDSNGKRKRRDSCQTEALQTIEKFFIPFRRWLTLLIQLRSETISSVDSIVYLFVGDEYLIENMSLTIATNSSLHHNSATQWRSHQLQRMEMTTTHLNPFLSENSEFEDVQERDRYDEEGEGEEGEGGAWREAHQIQQQIQSKQEQELGQGQRQGQGQELIQQKEFFEMSQIGLISEDVQSEAEKYQLLEKRLLDEVGGDVCGNPKQRRRLFPFTKTNYSHSSAPTLVSPPPPPPPPPLPPPTSQAIQNFLQECAKERGNDKYLLEAAL